MNLNDAMMIHLIKYGANLIEYGGLIINMIGLCSLNGRHEILQEVIDIFNQEELNFKC